MKTLQIEHPFIQHKLSILRDKNTGTKEFREIVKELSTILCYEAMKDAKLNNIEIETPISKMQTGQLDETKYAFVPILRAGMGMLEGVIHMIPNAQIGHIGMYRDEKTFEPVNYFFKVPKDIQNREVIILDPMLATGGSAVAAISACKKRGYTNIRLMCLVGVPQGVEAVEKAHPDVHIYLASLDEKLNEKGYIIPGLGDAGDRIFGTK